MTVHCQDNFRTPRQVCQVLNALKLSHAPIEARSAYEGEVPNFHPYTTEAQLRRQTEAAVKHLLSLGIALSDIALVSWRGLMNSVLVQTPLLGECLPVAKAPSSLTMARVSSKRQEPSGSVHCRRPHGNARQCHKKY